MTAMLCYVMLRWDNICDEDYLRAHHLLASVLLLLLYKHTLSSRPRIFTSPNLHDPAYSYSSPSESPPSLAHFSPLPPPPSPNTSIKLPHPFPNTSDENSFPPRPAPSPVPPKTVNIHLPEVPLVAGQRTRLECVALGAHPSAILTWTKALRGSAAPLRAPRRGSGSPLAGKLVTSHGFSESHLKEEEVGT
ncbi:hypothetical protein E2C01_016233 [Portunus trituberculatus]|uniref:Ig-like domain-containing protein n=1 Tax=Portunus trituberculatus TaxID=210409 RepID=A0A5B7DQ85_PORTR|nr:hypothetical protein [Portunus trituberculatus]